MSGILSNLRVNAAVTRPSQPACTGSLTCSVNGMKPFHFVEVHMKLRTIWLVVLLLVPSIGWAQSDTRIAGTVRDSSGGAIPGAKVSVKNEKTGEERKTTTSTQGYFLVAGLKPSTYDVKVEMGSFAPLEYPAMEVRASQELALDFELHPANLQESVEVTADATIMDIGSARNGANVTQLEVNSLPINGRQMSQLLLQAPGSLNSGTGTWQDIRFSGRASNENVIKYDGIE